MIFPARNIHLQWIFHTYDNQMVTNLAIIGDDHHPLVQCSTTDFFRKYTINKNLCLKRSKLTCSSASLHPFSHIFTYFHIVSHSFTQLHKRKNNQVTNCQQLVHSFTYMLTQFHIHFRLCFPHIHWESCSPRVSFGPGLAANRHAGLTQIGPASVADDMTISKCFTQMDDSKCQIILVGDI